MVLEILCCCFQDQIGFIEPVLMPSGKEYYFRDVHEYEDHLQIALAA